MATLNAKHSSSVWKQNLTVPQADTQAWEPQPVRMAGTPGGRPGGAARRSAWGRSCGHNRHLCFCYHCPPGPETCAGSCEAVNKYVRYWNEFQEAVRWIWEAKLRGVIMSMYNQQILEISRKWRGPPPFSCPWRWGREFMPPMFLPVTAHTGGVGQARIQIQILTGGLNLWPWRFF